MNGFGDALAAAFMATIIACIVITALVTTALIFGVPWLWSLLKPWLHMVTA